MPKFLQALGTKHHHKKLSHHRRLTEKEEELANARHDLTRHEGMFVSKVSDIPDKLLKFQTTTPLWELEKQHGEVHHLEEMLVASRKNMHRTDEEDESFDLNQEGTLAPGLPGMENIERVIPIHKTRDPEVEKMMRLHGKKIQARAEDIPFIQTMPTETSKFLDPALVGQGGHVEDRDKDNDFKREMELRRMLFRRNAQGLSSSSSGSSSGSYSEGSGDSKGSSELQSPPSPPADYDEDGEAVSENDDEEPPPLTSQQGKPKLKVKLKNESSEELNDKDLANNNNSTPKPEEKWTGWVDIGKINDSLVETRRILFGDVLTFIPPQQCNCKENMEKYQEAMRKEKEKNKNSGCGCAMEKCDCHCCCDAEVEQCRVQLPPCNPPSPRRDINNNQVPNEECREDVSQNKPKDCAPPPLECLPSRLPPPTILPMSMFSNFPDPCGKQNPSSKTGKQSKSRGRSASKSKKNKKPCRSKSGKRKNKCKSRTCCEESSSDSESETGLRPGAAFPQEFLWFLLTLNTTSNFYKYQASYNATYYAALENEREVSEQRRNVTRIDVDCLEEIVCQEGETALRNKEVAITLRPFAPDSPCIPQNPLVDLNALRLFSQGEKETECCCVRRSVCCGKGTKCKGDGDACEVEQEQKDNDCCPVGPPANCSCNANASCAPQCTITCCTPCSPCTPTYCAPCQPVCPPQAVCYHPPSYCYQPPPQLPPPCPSPYGYPPYPYGLPPYGYPPPMPPPPFAYPYGYPYAFPPGYCYPPPPCGPPPMCGFGPPNNGGFGMGAQGMGAQGMAGQGMGGEDDDSYREGQGSRGGGNGRGNGRNVAAGAAGGRAGRDSFGSGGDREDQSGRSTVNIVTNYNVQPNTTSPKNGNNSNKGGAGGARGSLDDRNNNRVSGAGNDNGYNLRSGEYGGAMVREGNYANEGQQTSNVNLKYVRGQKK